jgi:hypothetical protein
MLVVIAEPLWVKAFRVRVVVGVMMQCVYWDEDAVSWTQFQWRIRFQCVVLNTESIYCRRWWVEP